MDLNIAGVLLRKEGSRRKRSGSKPGLDGTSSMPFRVPNFVFVSQSLTVLLTMMSSTLLVHPVIGRSTPDRAGHQMTSAGNDIVSTGSERNGVKCQPVPHDTLWLRLNLEPTSFDSRSRLTGLSDEAQPTLNSVYDNGYSDERTFPREQEQERGSKKASTEAGTGKKMRRSQQQRLFPGRLPKRRPEDKNETKESWNCRMETKWKKMKEGTFPPYIQTGKCKQTKCMMGLFQCTPQKYLIKVLRRVDAACFPVPVIGVNSTYEEAWTFSDFKVTVGCDCVRRKSGTYLLPGKGIATSRGITKR